MTDRELLELAAKAVGLPECGWMGPAFMYVKDNTFTDWNPLTDDGDALRLAVKLNLTRISLSPTVCIVQATDMMADTPAIVVQHIGQLDPYAATRRAITRAAAEIGKAK
jgi:hypothetical protein